MKTQKMKVLMVVILLFFTSPAMWAKENADSLRIVHEALQMIAFPDPVFPHAYQAALSPKAMADMGFEQLHEYESINFVMEDGVQLHAQKYAKNSGSTLILLHGVLSSSFTYNKMAGLLREALQAEIVAIDLRGHGQSGGIPGDVSATNQYAKDLDEVIAAVKHQQPGQKIILAGHSMGGGIVLRHAETFPDTKVDGYLLFAPNLGTSAPTSSKNLALENNFVRSHLSRGLGLRMLNELGIHRYDSLKVVYYNLPEQMPLRSYSYRSMEACVPIDYVKALRNIDQPLLVLLGKNDETFLAHEYPAVIEAYSGGECYLVEGETHNGIRHSSEAMTKVDHWAFKHQLKSNR